MANRNFANSRIYTGHVMPVLLDCNFTVDNTNASGITGLKGPYIQAAYMHTTTTPSAGNPNPVAGTIVVQMQDNYNRSYSGFHAFISPTSGSALKIDNSALTAGTAYIITTLGNSTAAQWHAIGVPAGVTPATGVAFIAASVGAGANTSTSRVMTTAAAGSSVASIETVGDPNTSIAPDPTKAQGYGASFILQCRDYAGAIVAPAAGTVISLAFYLSNSSVTINGE